MTYHCTIILPSGRLQTSAVKNRPSQDHDAAANERAQDIALDGNDDLDGHMMIVSGPSDQWAICHEAFKYTLRQVDGLGFVADRDA